MCPAEQGRGQRSRLAIGTVHSACGAAVRSWVSKAGQQGVPVSSCGPGGAQLPREKQFFAAQAARARIAHPTVVAVAACRAPQRDNPGVAPAWRTPPPNDQQPASSRGGACTSGWVSLRCMIVCCQAGRECGRTVKRVCQRVCRAAAMAGPSAAGSPPALLLCRSRRYCRCSH